MKEVVQNFAKNWLAIRTTTKGERQIVMQFAKQIDKMMEAKDEEKT